MCSPDKISSVDIKKNDQNNFGRSELQDTQCSVKKKDVGKSLASKLACALYCGYLLF